MIKYELRCSSCGRGYPILVTDPSKAPVCKWCNIKMDAFPVEEEVRVDAWMR